MVNETHMEQIKYTDAHSFTVKVSEWKQVRADADRAGRVPRLVIDFERDGVRLIVTEEPKPR